jgi:hypothetical protein
MVVHLCEMCREVLTKDSFSEYFCTQKCYDYWIAGWE